MPETAREFPLPPYGLRQRGRDCVPADPDVRDAAVLAAVAKWMGDFADSVADDLQERMDLDDDLTNCIPHDLRGFSWNCETAASLLGCSIAGHIDLDGETFAADLRKLADMLDEAADTADEPTVVRMAEGGAACSR